MAEQHTNDEADDAGQGQQQDSAPDYLSMSDEDAAKLPAPDPAGFQIEAATEAVNGSPSEGEGEPDDGAGEGEAQSDDAGDEQGEGESDPEQGETQQPARRDKAGRFIKPGTQQAATADDAGTDGGARSAPGQSGKAADASGKPAGDSTTTPSPATPINYEEAYKQLMGPFRANGREVQVQSVEEAVQLMQMGAGFSRKMQQLRPNLKLMKMLQNNGLLDEAKLSFLIDLEKKNPEAINKLIKDSGIDPVDLDPDKATAYRQSSYQVHDKELELDHVLDSLQDSPGYQRTLDVVANRWDQPSKQVVADEPRLIQVIHDHIQRGVYDLIATEVDRRRTLGQLEGLSDIAAYRQVGDDLQQRGGFNHLIPQAQSTGSTSNSANGTAANQGETNAARSAAGSRPNPGASGGAARSSHATHTTSAQDAATAASRAEKRRAAGSSRPAAPSSQRSPDFNPLALSDEEFSKMVVPGVT